MFFLQRNLPAWERAFRLGGALVMGLTGIAGFCPACALVGRKPAAKGKP